MTIDEKVMPRSRRQQARGVTGDALAAAPSWKRRRSNDLVRQERRTAVFLAAPAAIVAIGVIVAPLFYAGWLSLHRTPLVGGSVFAGFTEYDQVLHSGAFWSSIWVTAEVAVPTIIIELILGTTLALLLQGLRGAGTIRLLLIIPILLSPAIVGADWSVMLNRSTGIINYLLGVVHLPQASFTASTRTALPTVDVIYAWQNVGFTLLVITAGLASIPHELLDAIIVDGASYLQRLRYLLLPMLAPLFAIIVFWRFITLVEDYGLIGLLTGGGPGTSTTTATLYLYNQLTAGDNVGVASAAAVLIALITIAVGMVLARFALLNKRPLNEQR
jgi:multiple sugar transport system permease protein